MLLSTETYSHKAREILDSGLRNPPYYDVRSDLDNKPAKDAIPELEDVDEGHLQGGMMLYTSGTTNRPVSRLVLDRLIQSGTLCLTEP